MTKVVGVPAYLARQGYSAGTRVVATAMSVTDAPTRRALQLGESDLVVDVRRLRPADGTLSLDHARFPADRFPGLLEQPLGGSLYELIEKEYGVAIADTEEIVEIVHATDEEAAVLAVTWATRWSPSPGQPMTPTERPSSTLTTSSAPTE